MYCPQDIHLERGDGTWVELGKGQWWKYAVSPKIMDSGHPLHVATALPDKPWGQSVIAKEGLHQRTTQETEQMEPA